MVAYTQPVRMKLVSGSPWARPAMIPMIVVLTIGWIFILAWFLAAFWVYKYNPLWTVTMVASCLLFSVVLTAMSYKLIADFHKRYELEITDDDAVMSVYDELTHRLATQMVLLDDVNYAEYYPYTDSACIILHSSYAQMEVPLWPIGRRAQDVIDFLEGRGIKVVNVQTDDKIPD